MINVTDAALQELKRIANAEGDPLRVRIAMKGGGCSGMTVDMSFTKDPKDDEFDLTFTQDGVEFLVDKKSSFWLTGAILDYQQKGLLSRGFMWSFPKSTGECGCHTSFSF